MIKKRKKIACFSIAGVLLCASVSYAYIGKKKSSPIQQAHAKQAEVVAAVNITAGVASTPDAQQVPAQNENTAAPQPPLVQYPVHSDVSTTYFWAGEPADKDNKNISNVPSAWDDNWETDFGGVDNPKTRNGLVVASFVPKENSFYFALPYDDFDDNGNRKKDVDKIIPWASSKQWGDMESMCKNQWIKITKGEKTAYAQWEDVGPFSEDDSAYVFGNAKPQSKTNDDAGLDVSPSVRDFLGLSDVDKTDWQFVSADQVPDGPWKTKITTLQISWN